MISKQIQHWRSTMWKCEAEYSSRWNQSEDFCEYTDTCLDITKTVSWNLVHNDLCICSQSLLKIWIFSIISGHKNLTVWCWICLSSSTLLKGRNLLRWTHWKKLLVTPGIWQIQPLDPYGSLTALEEGNRHNRGFSWLQCLSSSIQGKQWQKLSWWANSTSGVN